MMLGGLGGSWIPPKPNSETLSRKLLAFWWFCKKSILQGGHRRKVRRLHRSFWDKWELAGTRSRVTRKQISGERNSIPDYPLWERRATFAKQLVLVNIRSVKCRSHGFLSRHKENLFRRENPNPNLNWFFCTEIKVKMFREQILNAALSVRTNWNPSKNKGH